MKLTKTCNECGSSYQVDPRVERRKRRCDACQRIKDEAYRAKWRLKDRERCKILKRKEALENLFDTSLREWTDEQINNEYYKQFQAENKQPDND